MFHPRFSNSYFHLSSINKWIRWKLERPEENHLPELKLYTRDEYSGVHRHVKDGRVVMGTAPRPSRRRPQDRTGPTAWAHPSSGGKMFCNQVFLSWLSFFCFQYWDKRKRWMTSSFRKQGGHAERERPPGLGKITERPKNSPTKVNREVEPARRFLATEGGGV